MGKKHYQLEKMCPSWFTVQGQTYWLFLVLSSGTVFSIFAETASSPQWWQIQTLIVWSLSSADVSLCSRRGGEQKKEITRGTLRREERKPFPLPIVPRALFNSRLLLFSLGYPARAFPKERIVWWLFWNRGKKVLTKFITISTLQPIVLSFYFYKFLLSRNFFKLI